MKSLPIDIKRVGVVLTLAAVGLSGCAEGPTPPDFASHPSDPLFGKGEGLRIPGTAFVNDETRYKVRSDGKGTQQLSLYVDAEQCVSVALRPKHSFFQLRTVANTEECNTQKRGVWRFLTFDLSADPNHDLDQDGLTEDLEEVPARFLALDAFPQKGETTPVEVYVAGLNPDGTIAGRKWELRYQREAHVVVQEDGSRVISLEPGEAAAELCEVVEVQQGKKRTKQVCELRATLDMPFHVTAAAK